MSPIRCFSWRWGPAFGQRLASNFPRAQTDENKPEAAVLSIAMGALENSACFCQFADREVTIPEWLELFNTVPGYKWEIPDMMKAGRRIYYLKRLINYKYGLTAKDDELTPRMLEPARDGEPEGVEKSTLRG